MNDTLLMKIGEDVKQFAETMSRVLILDVDIADNKLQRVAGTGKFALNNNEPVLIEGNAFREVVRTKKYLFIEDASTNELCINCIKLDKCKDQCELCCPILFNDEVIGIISISSSTLDQKERIHRNFSKYLSFLENIADLISTKVFEFISYQETSVILDLMYKLINLINDGVLILDSKDNIIYINKKTELLFGNTLPQIKYLQKINQFGLRKSFKNDEMELNIKIKGKMLKLHGKLYPIEVGANANQIFIFQDLELYRQKLIQTNTMEDYTFDYLVGSSESLGKVCEQCDIYSVTENNLLIYGETGTGKEMFARLIHRNSVRKNKPFVAITCSGSLETSLDKEIFGEDSNQHNLGKLNIANDGTLFIDEISDLPIRLQGKLMNLIYRGEIKCRIIATTNKNLKELVRKGEFRENLFYALETFTLWIPPLRKRKEDIIPMTKHFLKKYNHMEGKEIELSKDIYDVFLKYSWNGNIRELSNVVSYIIANFSGNKIVELKDLPSGLYNKLLDPTLGNFNLEENEKRLIISALNSYGNSQNAKIQVAKELGISKATLYRKLKKYKIMENTTYDTNI